MGPSTQCPPAEGSPSAGSLKFHELLVQFGPAYLERFGSTMPVRQREVLEKLWRCRTPALGGELWSCPQCHQVHYRYHSCNDRHCPQCGQSEAEAWRARQEARLLLPAPYFLVTFTVPEPLRAWLRSHPRLGYDLLFEASAGALQDLARNPKRLGASVGLLGVLHTWSRTLLYHPHIHYLVPGGGLSLDERSWVPSRPGFLVRVEPLSDHFRTRFKVALQQRAPELFGQVPPAVWKQRWVVHSQPAGSGQRALRYLSRYVFKTATGNRRLERLPNGLVRWPYRDSRTGRWQAIKLEPLELIRRFLQHVLPAGYTRVRCFGWFHPAGRKKLNRVRALLKEKPLLTPAEGRAWQLPQEEFEPLASGEETSAQRATPALPRCPCCGCPMQRIGCWRPGQWPCAPPRGPPR
jgi:hypothetical protein